MSITLRRLDPDGFRSLIRERDRAGFTQPKLDEAGAVRLAELFGRRIDAGEAVRIIVTDVRERGDAAVREWTERLDGVTVTDARVDPAALEDCARSLDAGVRNSLAAAA
jgi:histidinol dehydrogenase